MVPPFPRGSSVLPFEYYKRHRMRCELPPAFKVPALPAGYRWHPWRDALADVYADVLRRAFIDEPDSQLFPSLGSETGCRMLVRAIRDVSNFCPEATWLIEGPSGAAGAILGMIELGDGSIQNLAVVPEARERGLGTALIVQSLAGFASAGVLTVELEVTVANCSAMALYRRLGFRAYKTTYRSVERPDRSMVGLGI